MKTIVRTFGIGAAAAAAWMLVAGVTPQSAAQEEEAAPPAQPEQSAERERSGVSVQELLRQLRETRRVESAENRRRLQEFRAQRNRQRALLNQAEQDLANEKALSEQLEETRDENEEELARLEQQLQEELGNFAELFGVTRQVAGDTISQMQTSLISAEFPAREREIDILTRSRTLPTDEDLGSLWLVLLENAVQQGRISTFTATVTELDGELTEREVMRVGPFVAVTKERGNFLRFESGQLEELPRQPQARFMEATDNLVNADPGERTNAAIDPSSGALLGLLVRTPSLLERIDQGRTIGYIIITIGAIGVLLAIYRFLDLSKIAGSVRSQMKKDTPGNNPLGRIMKAYQENKNADVETLELKLDDAILKELPRLEMGLATIKVMAAVAPLLGLLGTVTGMIIVFQQITLFGTGDPKIMAGGISQALVTTVLGLTVAIPLLLLHSVANGRAKYVSQILEEQSAGLVAQHSEKHGKA